MTSKPVDQDDYNSILSPKRLMYAAWLPNSGAALVFVQDFSVFYTPDVVEKKVYPISSLETTVADVVIHGIPDWIYEGKANSTNTIILQMISHRTN